MVSDACIHARSVASVLSDSVILWTIAHQAPLSTGFSRGFSRQEYCSGLPCPPPGGLPEPGIEPESPAAPALQASSLLLSHGEARLIHSRCLINTYWMNRDGTMKSCWDQIFLSAIQMRLALLRWNKHSFFTECVLRELSRSVVSDSRDPIDYNLSCPCCLWGFPGKNTGVGCHFLTQGIFLT